MSPRPTANPALLRLSAKLSRLALDIAETVDAITAGTVTEPESWLLAPEIAHLELSLDWLKQVVYEAELQRGGYKGLDGHNPPMQLSRTRSWTDDAVNAVAEPIKGLA